MYNKRKLLIALSKQIEQGAPMEVLEQMWREQLLDKTAVEKLYIRTEVERRVRAGEGKTKAMEQLSAELNCSYEKVRTAVYSKKH